MNKRIQRAIRSATDEIANATLEVYYPTVSTVSNPSGAEEFGANVTHPDPATADPDAEVSGRVDSPDSATDRTIAGLEADIDAVLYVDDDTGVTWAEYPPDADSDEPTAPVRVRDTKTRVVYEVEDITDQHNGRLELPATEV